MSTETLDMPSGTVDTEHPFFTPTSAEEFQRFVESEIGVHLQETNEAEVNQQKILWRGHNPGDVVALLHGQREHIELQSHHPNVTLDWHKAIAYNKGGENIRYNIAMGFMPPDDWSSQPAETATPIPEDLQQYRDISEYQRGNFIARGKISSDNLRYIIVRPHGQAGQGPGPCRFYKIAA